MPGASTISNHTSHGPTVSLIRSSSFESIHTATEDNDSQKVALDNDEERKRQAKLRSRACNDSFRQAVDKSYGQNQSASEDGKLIRFRNIKFSTILPEK